MRLALALGGAGVVATVGWLVWAVLAANADYARLRADDDDHRAQPIGRRRAVRYLATRP